MYNKNRRNLCTYTHTGKCCWFFLVLLWCVAVCADDKNCDSGYVFIKNRCVRVCSADDEWKSYAKENRLYCLNNKSQKCPKGSWPNVNLTDCECKYNLKKQNNTCVGFLSKNDLLYGPGGASAEFSEQCWTKNQTYTKCMGFDNENLETDKKCGYVIIGRAGDYNFDYVLENTDLIGKLIEIKGEGVFSNKIAAVRAEKSLFANTDDGCACPSYLFEYKGKTAYFYNWTITNELKESVVAIQNLNAGVDLDNRFACLLREYDDRTDYMIKFAYGCDVADLPNPDKDKYDMLFSAVGITTNTNKIKTVDSVCPGVKKTGWKCKTLLKKTHNFYLNTEKTYKDNTGLREYINVYGTDDWMRVRQGFQQYGNNRESEMIVAFCVPSDVQ